MITGTPTDRELRALIATFYSPWGIAPGLTIFVQRLTKEADCQQFSSPETAANKFGIFYNARLSRAYQTAGSGKFKPGTTDHDFRPEMLLNSLLATPREISGSTMQLHELITAQFIEMKKEPPTEPVPPENFHTAFGGIETPLPQNGRHEAKAADKANWAQSGYKWIDGFMPASQSKVLRFLAQQELAGNQVAKAAQGVSLFQKPGFIPKVPRISKIEELVLTESDYRLCCRNTIHTWDFYGNIEEIGNTHHSIEHLLKCKPNNFRTVITILQLQDRSIMQDFLCSGMSQRTTAFPLNTLCSANLKSSSIHAAPLNKQWKDSVTKGELSGADPHAIGDAIYDLAKHPPSIPFLIVPMGAAVQHFKEEQYYLHKNGDPCKINCRGVFDGSSPHPQDGEAGISPNDHVNIPDYLVLPWTSRKKFSWNLAVLSGCSRQVSIFHLDYEGAYRQCSARVSERWRQTVFWKCFINGQLRGGYGEDLKMQWGGTAAANNFHRAVTNTTVKWILYVLRVYWQPHITDEATLQWISNRRLAGFKDTQALPATVDGFLDDFIIALCGNEEDKELGRIWVLAAIDYLGMTLSKAKFVEDGMLNNRCNFLGDNYDLVNWTRGIPQHKQDRLMDTLPDMLHQKRWRRKTLESLLGLLESVKGNVPRKWNLLPLYRILHSKDSEYPINEPPEYVNPSDKGKLIIERIMNTVHERRSLFWQPSQWPNPSNILLEWVAENDACIIKGFGGTIRIGNTLFYMAEEWEHVPGYSDIDIFSLECFTILLMVLTLGDSLANRKIIFRSDSSNTCSTLNKLFSKNPVMMRLADIWDDMLFNINFEGLLCWIPGKENVFSDHASRLTESVFVEKFRILLDDAGLNNVALQKMETVWSTKGFNLKDDFKIMGVMSRKRKQEMMELAKTLAHEEE
jgi:hypothetical protein